MKTLGIDIGGSALKGAPVDTATGRMLAERFRIETLLPHRQDVVAGAEHFLRSELHA